MEQFLAMLERGQVAVEHLTTHRFPVSDAEQAYELLTTPESRPIGILLSYPDADTTSKDPRVWMDAEVPPTDESRSDVRVGLLGAGSFAKSVLLPNLMQDSRVSLRGVMTASGLTAQSVAKQYGFAYCASNAEEIAADAETDCVVIATRHDTHAALTTQALEQGKSVFVEKPLALTIEELSQVTRAQREHSGLVMVGFNRRFSPHTLELKKFFEGRAFPLMLNYRVNAGPLPADHWHKDAGQGGGRLLGEAAHFIDLISTVVGSNPVSVFASGMPAESGLPEDATITLRFADGSVGTVSYICSGDTALSKERLEVFGGGSSAVIDDFRSTQLFRGGKKQRSRPSGQGKGHKEELEAFITALATGDTTSVAFDQSVMSTLATIRAVESIATGMPLPIDGADLVQPEAGQQVMKAMSNGSMEVRHG
jgi:polar amino acid transport system substrate-binding protein